ncbi:hypothetical protein HYH03_007209 [Edaphochlamys debaryana]|uniref:Uncharacterized protein n=1 Tax=Edaphochlamys debaryana TaxID=47281 RepID=A0A835Y4Q7_9CHLO|nr:hypothetical protein HYH03_007209 [Edaphochlamys debaryana]|eukprot:KAG2494693.1 hypothetical protein HYH03_007209 [Edaphochlamys debaryana]
MSYHVCATTGELTKQPTSIAVGVKVAPQWSHAAELRYTGPLQLRPTYGGQGNALVRDHPSEAGALARAGMAVT